MITCGPIALNELKPETAIYPMIDHVVVAKGIEAAECTVVLSGGDTGKPHGLLTSIFAATILLYDSAEMGRRNG